MKIKESDKIDKYLDISRELRKKLRKLRLTVIPIVFGALGTVPKNMKMGLEEMEEL